MGKMDECDPRQHCQARNGVVKRACARGYFVREVWERMTLMRVCVREQRGYDGV